MAFCQQPDTNTHSRTTTTTRQSRGSTPARVTNRPRPAASTVKMSDSPKTPKMKKRGSIIADTKEKLASPKVKMRNHDSRHHLGPLPPTPPARSAT